MRSYLILFAACAAFAAAAQSDLEVLPIRVGAFQQQTHVAYTAADGLPADSVLRIATDEKGRIVAETAQGTAVWDGGKWSAEPRAAIETANLSKGQLEALRAIAGPAAEIRAAAFRAGETAAACDTGLYLHREGVWSAVYPRQGAIGWAPVDIRAVAYDSEGALWFAAPQGVGRREATGAWTLYTGAEGLPYNDLTCIAAGPHGLWFGTTNGAIHFRDGAWSFRQGRRWLLDNRVNGIAVDAAGDAWIATPSGVSRIAHIPMTLADKADFFESELDTYHRRTPFGFVNPAVLSVPGDKATAVPEATDNDGQRMGMYLGAVGLAYKATGDPRHKKAAQDAFRALAFLSEVTQGGTHPAPSGFVARCIRPTSGPDPNEEYGPDYDARRREEDALWKLIQPRWPIDESGQWYWMNDGSADELDGHFFGYGIYFDNVCETEAERDEVRAVVRRIADHLLDHGYNIVDFDGKPTRWGRFSPDALLRDHTGVIERGLRSMAILNYLIVTHHITGDPKYRDAYLELALDYGYAMNFMTQPRDIMGPGTSGQGDDKMAFLNYYHLLRYEADPNLLNMYFHAANRHWLLEQYEACPWANFIYAACCMGKVRTSQWGVTDLTPPPSAFTEAADTLKRYPMDLIAWPMSNAHRIDMVPLRGHLGQDVTTTGRRVDGKPFPIDERSTLRWGEDPYLLSSQAAGDRLGKGVHYMLAYYLGRAHGFIAE